MPELIKDLRTDLSDGEAALFTDETLERCIMRGASSLSTDTGRTIDLGGDEHPGTRELILLLGQINACRVMRSKTANAFSFSSGDKRVDKTSQAGHWTKLEADLTEEYRKKLAVLVEGNSGEESEYIITPRGLSPLIFHQGKSSPERW